MFKFAKPKLDSYQLVNNYHTATIEAIRACPVKCVPCPVGRNVIDQHTFTMLDKDKARKLFAKLRNELHIKTLIFGNWGEPLLNPEISNIVSIGKTTGFDKIGITTSLSVNYNMSEIVSSGVDFIEVSISGITNDVYNVSHKKGDIKLVLENLEILSAVAKQLKNQPVITLKWHRYRHNEFQLEAANALCKKLGIKFMPYYGHLGGFEALKDWENNKLEEPLNTFVQNSVFTDFIKQACSQNIHSVGCRQSNILTIDADGTLLFCCACYKHYRESRDFLSMSLQDLVTFKKLDSPVCAECLSKGWAGYMNRPKTLEEYGGVISIDSACHGQTGC